MAWLIGAWMDRLHAKRSAKPERTFTDMANEIDQLYTEPDQRWVEGESYETYAMRQNEIRAEINRINKELKEYYSDRPQTKPSAPPAPQEPEDIGAHSDVPIMEAPAEVVQEQITDRVMESNPEPSAPPEEPNAPNPNQSSGVFSFSGNHVIGNETVTKPTEIVYPEGTLDQWMADSLIEMGRRAMGYGAAPLPGPDGQTNQTQPVPGGQEDYLRHSASYAEANPNTLGFSQIARDFITQMLPNSISNYASVVGQGVQDAGGWVSRNTVGRAFSETTDAGIPSELRPAPLPQSAVGLFDTIYNQITRAYGSLSPDMSIQAKRKYHGTVSDELGRAMYAAAIKHGMSPSEAEGDADAARKRFVTEHPEPHAIDPNIDDSNLNPDPVSHPPQNTRQPQPQQQQPVPPPVSSEEPVSSRTRSRTAKAKLAQPPIQTPAITTSMPMDAKDRAEYVAQSVYQEYLKRGSSPQEASKIAQNARQNVLEAANALKKAKPNMDAASSAQFFQKLSGYGAELAAALAAKAAEMGKNLQDMDTTEAQALLSSVVHNPLVQTGGQIAFGFAGLAATLMYMGVPLAAVLPIVYDQMKSSLFKQGLAGTALFLGKAHIQRIFKEASLGKLAEIAGGAYRQMRGSGGKNPGADDNDDSNPPDSGGPPGPPDGDDPDIVDVSAASSENPPVDLSETVELAFGANLAAQLSGRNTTSASVPPPNDPGDVVVNTRPNTNPPGTVYGLSKEELQRRNDEYMAAQAQKRGDLREQWRREDEAAEAAQQANGSVFKTIQRALQNPASDYLVPPYATPWYDMLSSDLEQMARNYKFAYQPQDNRPDMTEDLSQWDKTGDIPIRQPAPAFSGPANVVGGPATIQTPLHLATSTPVRAPAGSASGGGGGGNNAQILQALHQVLRGGRKKRRV